MTKVSEIMTEQVVALPPSATVEEAAREMRRFDVGAIALTEWTDGLKLYGIVTERDIVLRGLAEGRPPALTMLGEICTRDVVTVGASDDVERAVALMREQRVRHLPVLSEQRLVGMVSVNDLVRDPSGHAVSLRRHP